ncbi:MAG: protein kinase [Planctomycetes bacterium]|nr:protein kinase [Planctomycetota bacterium]
MSNASSSTDAPSGDDAPLRPATASVLAALVSRGVDLPGIERAAVASLAGRYEVVDEVGRGGMGVILRVRDADLRRELAMKVLDRKGRTGAEESAPRDVARFLEEAQVTGQLDHPGVPPIHELGLSEDGRLYFTMKLVRGGTFADVIAHVKAGTENWTLTKALGVVLKVCEAMAYAHHKGVVHRDIKPANIMVGRFGETYVMDWGLARVLDSSAAPTAGGTSTELLVSRSIVHTDRRQSADDIDTSHVTLDGDVIGTPAYMAPEQARGDLGALGPRSDVYAVGAMLYHLVGGQAPYLEPGVRVSPNSVLRWVLEGPPKPLAQLAPEAPPELVAVIDKAMARDASQRYESMLALADDLQAFIEDRVVRAYQSGAWAEFRKWVRRNKALAASFAAVLVVTVGALAAVGFVQAAARAEVEQKNDELADSNEALGAANDALGSANAQLEDRNVQLAKTNTALDESRAVANAARVQAEQAAALAAANERIARVESYAAHVNAAAVALDQGSRGAARRHLDACPEDMRGWGWRHLSLRADAGLATYVGPDALFYDSAFSPDGKTVATASGTYFGFGGIDHEVRLWDAASGATRVTLPIEGASPLRVAFSPDGSLLMWGDSSGYITIYEIARRRERPTRHWIGGWPRVLDFLDDERVLLFTLQDTFGAVEVWNVRTLEVELSRETTPEPTAAAGSSDGAFVAVGYADASLELLAADGTTVWRRAGRPFDPENPGDDGVACLAFSQDGSRLAVADDRGVLQLVDTRDGRELVARALAEGVSQRMQFHPDGPWIVFSDLSGSLVFVDSESLTEIERLPASDMNAPSVAIRPDGDMIATAGWDKALRLWDGRPGTAAQVVSGETAIAPGLGDNGRDLLAFSPDGRLVAFCPDERVVLVADAYTGEALYRLDGIMNIVGALAFSTDGRRLLVQSDGEGLQTYQVADGRRVAQVPITEQANCADFDATRTLFAMSRSDSPELVHVYLVETGDLVAVLRGHEMDVGSCRFMPDGQRLVSCSEDRTIRVWDLRTGRAERVIESPEDTYFLALADGGRRALVTSIDPTRKGLDEWDLETGEHVAWHPSGVRSARGALHPDGRRWASADQRRTVTLWDRERGEMFSLAAGDSSIRCTAFDPSGTRLAAIDGGGDLHLWESEPSEERRAARLAAAPRLRLRDEARALVASLVEEHVTAARVIDALRADASLDPALRDAAVRAARVRGDDPTTVFAQVWVRLLAESLPSADTIALAEFVDATWGISQEAIEPLAYARFAAGDLDRADEVLRRAEAARYADQSSCKIVLPLRALLYLARGDEAAARVWLGRARTDLERALVQSKATAQFVTMKALMARVEAELAGG